MKINHLERELLSVGYVPRRTELLAVASALNAPATAGRSLLCEGLPGVGKTALAEAVASIHGAPLVYGLMHSWSDDQELFCGVDVAAAVAGEAELVRQDGLLARAARLSVEHDLVVVCIDEIDKAPERVEYLLLDWLQTGRVPIQPGRHLQTRMENVLVIMTTNGARDLSAPFLRRVRRVKMQPLSKKIAVAILSQRTDTPQEIAALAWSALQGDEPVSLQEVECFLREALYTCENFGDLRLAAGAWSPNNDVRSHLTPLWGEISKWRRTR